MTIYILKAYRQVKVGKNASKTLCNKVKRNFFVFSFQLIFVLELRLSFYNKKSTKSVFRRTKTSSSGDGIFIFEKI